MRTERAADRLVGSELDMARAWTPRREGGETRGNAAAQLVRAGLFAAALFAAVAGRAQDWSPPEERAVYGPQSSQHPQSPSSGQQPAEISDKQAARIMLQDARQWAAQGWLEPAIGLARKAEALGLTWDIGEDSPSTLL